MKNILLIPLFLSLLIWQHTQAQINNPVSWSYSTEKIGEKTWNVNLAATMDTGWYIYSQYMDAGGPIPTTITVDDGLPVVLKGSFREEGNQIKNHEDIFMMETRYYYDQVVFVLEAEVQGALPQQVTGTITYMACDGEYCTPPMEEKFGVLLQ